MRKSILMTATVRFSAASFTPTIFVLIVVSALFVGNFVLRVGADSVGYSPSAKTTSAIAYSTFSIQLAFSAVLAASMILLLRRHGLPSSHSDWKDKGELEIPGFIDVVPV